MMINTPAMLSVHSIIFSLFACILLIRRGNPLVGHSIEIAQQFRGHRQLQFQGVDCAVFGIDNALAIGIEIGPAPVLALDERLAIGVQKKMPLPIDLMQR